MDDEGKNAPITKCFDVDFNADKGAFNVKLKNVCSLTKENRQELAKTIVDQGTLWSGVKDADDKGKNEE